MLRCARNDGARGNGFALPVRILNHRRTFSSSRRISPELCSLHRPLKNEGAGKAGCRLAPTVRRAKAHAEELHSGIQVKPNTRPSLRSGRTAYAVLSLEPSSFWPPSPSRNSPTSRRLTRLPPPQELDRSNDGQDHTVLPYARPAISPQFSRPCRRSRKLTDETNLTAPLVQHEVLGSRRAIRPAHASRARRCRVHRKPGSRQ